MKRSHLITMFHTSVQELHRNNGIISKLRHYLTLLQMKQIYYSLIYPYISYAILAWGSAYKTHIDKIQTKQNHSARLIFFATAYGEHTESALPLLNFLDVLTVHNVYRFQILKFTYTSGIKAFCQSCFQTIFNMLVMYTNTIPGMHRNKTFT